MLLETVSIVRAKEALEQPFHRQMSQRLPWAQFKLLQERTAGLLLRKRKVL